MLSYCFEYKNCHSTFGKGARKLLDKLQTNVFVKSGECSSGNHDAYFLPIDTVITLHSLAGDRALSWEFSDWGRWYSDLCCW